MLNGPENERADLSRNNRDIAAALLNKKFNLSNDMLSCWIFHMKNCDNFQTTFLWEAMCDCHHHHQHYEHRNSNKRKWVWNKGRWEKKVLEYVHVKAQNQRSEQSIMPEKSHPKLLYIFIHSLTHWLFSRRLKKALSTLNAFESIAYSCNNRMCDEVLWKMCQLFGEALAQRRDGKAKGKKITAKKYTHNIWKKHIHFLCVLFIWNTRHTHETLFIFSTRFTDIIFSCSFFQVFFSLLSLFSFNLISLRLLLYQRKSKAFLPHSLLCPFVRFCCKM